MASKSSKQVIDDEDISEVGIPSFSSPKSTPSDIALFTATLSGVSFSQKVTFIPFSDKIKFGELNDVQRQQLIGEKEGWYYSCPKARHRQTPLIYPIVASAALRFIDPQRFNQENANFLNVHLEILSRVYSQRYILPLSDDEILKAQWSEECFQKFSEYAQRTVIVVVNLKGNKDSFYKFFYPDSISQITAGDSLPLVFLQGDTDFIFLYSRNRDQSINYNLSPTELQIFNEPPNTLSENIQNRPILRNLLRDYTIQPMKKQDLFEPINFIPYMISPSDPDYERDHTDLQTTFIYDVEGGPYNNAPQAISAGLLLNRVPKYWSRTEHNFLGVRMTIDKKRGIPTTLSDTGTFRMFDLADFGLAAVVYNATILIRYREQGEIAFYAKISSPTPSSIRIMLEYRENVFFLLLPDRLNENKLSAFNTPYSPEERKSDEFLANLGSGNFSLYRNVIYYLTPAFSEVSSYRASTSERKRRLKNLAKIIKGKKSFRDSDSSDTDSPRKSSSLPSSPSAASSSSSQFPISSSSLKDDEDIETNDREKKEKKRKEEEEEEERETELSLNENILIMPPVMRNSNVRRYKHATTDDTVSLIDNFKLTLFPNGRTRRQFNNNALFAWRIELSNKEGKNWPIIFTAKPIEIIFIHRSVPVDSYTVELPTIPPLSDNDVFFANMLSRLFVGSTPLRHIYLSSHHDYLVHARIASITPFGIVHDSRSSPLENGVIDIDGFMQFFDLVGTLVEVHAMKAHRYNLYRIYGSMIQDIDQGTFSNHRMTERILWFLYTFLLRDHPHFLGENPVFTDDMFDAHGNVADLFSVKLFTTLFGSTCFKWQWKLSHVWLFAYICLNPNSCTLPVKYLRMTFHTYVTGGVFKETLFNNTSTTLMRDSREILSFEKGTAISDIALRHLISWERFTEPQKVQLPLYTINYQLLFGAESQDGNRPELSISDLYYHTQIHDIILQSNAPSSEIQNVDNLLFSLQTIDGLPLTSYKINGFPAPGSRQEFLYGEKLAPVTIKKVARFIPGILDDNYEGDSSMPEDQLKELKTALLFTRIGKTADYFGTAPIDSTITREPKRSKFFEIGEKQRGWFQLSDKGDYIWDIDNSSNALRTAIKQWQEDYSIWKESIVHFPKITVGSNVLDQAPEMIKIFLTIQLNIKNKKEGKTFDAVRKELFDKALSMLANIHFSGNTSYTLVESRRQTELGKNLSEIKKLLTLWQVMKLKVEAMHLIMREAYGVTQGGSPLFILAEQNAQEDRVTNLRSMMNSLPTSSNTVTAGYQSVIEVVSNVLTITVPDIPLPPPYPVIPPSQSLKSEEFIQPPFQHLLRNTVGLAITGIEFIKRHHTVLNTPDALQSFTRRIRACVSSLDRTLVQLLAIPLSMNVWAFPVNKNGFSSPSEETVSYVRRQRDEILFSDKEIEHIVESRYMPHVLMPEIYPRPEEISGIYLKVSRAKLITETPFRKGTTQVVFNELIPSPNKITRAPTTRQENHRFLLTEDFKRFYLQENNFPWCFLTNVSVYSGIPTQSDFHADPATLGMNDQLFDFLKGIIWEGKNTSLQDVYRKFTLTCNCLRVKATGETPFLRTAHRNTVAERHRTRFPDVRFGTPNNILLPNLDVEYIIEYQIDSCFAMFPSLKTGESSQDRVFFLHAPLFLEFVGIREITATDRNTGTGFYRIGIITHLITFRVRIAEEFILSITPGFSNYHIKGYEYTHSSLLKNKQPTSIVSVSNTAAVPLVQYHTTSPTASKTVVKARQIPAYTRVYAYNPRLLNYIFWKGFLKERRYIPQVMSYLTEMRYSTMYHDLKDRLFENFDMIKPSPSAWRPNMPSQPLLPSSPTDITASKYDPSNISTFTFAFMVMEHVLGWPYPMAHYDTVKNTGFTLLSHVPIIYRSGPLYERDNAKYPFLLTDFLPFNFSEELEASSSDTIGAKLRDDPLVDDDDVSPDGEGGSSEGGKEDSSFEGERFMTTPGEAYLAAKRIGKQYKREVDASRARRKYLSRVMTNSPTFLMDLFWYLYDFPPPSTTSSSQKKQQSSQETEQRIRIRRLDNYRLHFPEAIWAVDDAYARNRLVNKEASTKELKKERGVGDEGKSTRDYTFVNTSFLYQPRTFRTLYQSEKDENRILITSTPELAEEKVWRERYNAVAASKGEENVGFIFSGIYPRTSPLGYTEEQVSEILNRSKLDESTQKKLKNSTTQSNYDFTNEYLILQDWGNDIKSIVRKISSDKPLTQSRSTKIVAVLTAILAKEFNDYGFLYPDLKLVCVMMSENLYTILTRLLGNVRHESILQTIRANLWNEWITEGYTVVFLPLFQILEQPSPSKKGKEEESEESENVLVSDDTPPVIPTSSSSSSSSSSSTPETLSDDESTSSSEETSEDEFFSTYFTTKFLSRGTSKKFLDASIIQLLRDVISFKAGSQNAVSRFGASIAQKKISYTNHVIIPQFLWHHDSDQRIVTNILKRFQVIFGSSIDAVTEAAKSSSLTWESVLTYADAVLTDRFLDVEMPLKKLRKTPPSAFNNVSSRAKRDGVIAKTRLLVYLPEVENEGAIASNEKRAIKVRNFDTALNSYNTHVASIVKSYDSLSVALKARDRYPDDITIDYLLLLSLLKIGDPSQTLKRYNDVFSLRCVLKKYTIGHLLLEYNPVLTPPENLAASNLRYIELTRHINENPIVETQQELDVIFTVRSFNALASKASLPEETITRFNDPSTKVQEKRVIFRTVLFNLKLQELKARYPVPSEEDQKRYDAREAFDEAYETYLSDRSSKENRKALTAAFNEMLSAHNVDASKTRTFGMTFTARAGSMHRRYLALKQKDKEANDDTKFYRNHLQVLYETEPTPENIFDLLADCEYLMSRQGIVSEYDLPTENNPRQNPLLEVPIRKTLLRQALLQFIFETAYPPPAEETHRRSQFLNKEINNKLLTIMFTKNQRELNEFLQVLDQILQRHLLTDLGNEESISETLVQRAYGSLNMNLVDFESSSLWTLNPGIFIELFTTDEIRLAAQRLVEFYRSVNDLRDSQYVRDGDTELIRRIWKERLSPSDVPLFQESTFKENFNLGSTYLITSINRGIAETILENRGDTHVFITSVFNIYNLTWDLAKTLDVLRRKKIISSTEIVTKDTEKMKEEEQNYEDSIDRMNGALVTTLSNTIFAHFRSFFKLTCLSYSRLFNSFRAVQPLTDYLMNRKSLSSISPFLEQLNISHDPNTDKVGDIVRRIRTLATNNVHKKYPWFKKSSDLLISQMETVHGCDFTNFEKKIIALVWNRSSKSMNISQAYELVSLIRKHAWHLLINTHDLIDLFTAHPKGEEGLSFALAFKSLGDVEMRERLSARFKLLMGRIPSKIEINFIRCCVLFGIPLDVIEKCVLAGRFRVLYALMDGRLTVSYKYQSIPQEERSPAKLERIIDTAIEATTIPSMTALFLPEVIDTREITIDQTGDLVQTVAEEVIPQDRPESYEHDIPITDETLNDYIEANKNFHDVLAKTRESSFKKANRSGVVTRSSKKRIVEQENVPTLTDLLNNATKIMKSRNRYITLGLSPVVLSTVRKNLTDGETLFKTLSYFFTSEHTVEEFSIYKEEVSMWLVNNLDTPLSDNTERSFRDILNIPLFTGYASELTDDISTDSERKRMEKEYYLNYLRSPLFWNDLVLLLAAAHVYKMPIHIVTSLSNDSNWHSTFYASVEHKDQPPLRILCLDMIYFFPLIEEPALSSIPSSSSSSSSELKDDSDIEIIGTSRSKWCYMAHEKTIRNHPITPAQRRKFFYECNKGELIGTSREKWCYMAHEPTVRNHRVTPKQRRKFWYECKK